MLKDIKSNTLVKDSGKDEGNPKADKPPSLSTIEDALEAVKPSSLRSIKDAPEGAKSLSPKAAEGTPKATKPPSSAAIEETPRTIQGNNSRENLTTPSPQAHGWGAAANAPIGEGSTWPWVEEVPQSSLQVTDSLAQDPNFIKVECHIGKYITTTVNTEAEQEDIQAVWSDLDSASLHINVSSPFHLILQRISRIWLPFLSRKLLNTQSPRISS
jgi:hypothetical protein